MYLTLAISAPNKLRFTALNFSSASFEWAEPLLCSNNVSAYIIQIILSIHYSNDVVYNTSSLTTSINVTGLNHGVEYSVSVFGVSYNNVMGEKTMIFMKLDGKYTVMHAIMLSMSMCCLFIYGQCSC